MTEVPLFLRSFRAPVLLCVWGDAALQQVVQASHPSRAPAVRQLDTNYWALVVPHQPQQQQQQLIRRQGTASSAVFRKTVYWIVANMARLSSEAASETRILLALRQEYRFQVVAVGPPLHFSFALDEDADMKAWVASTDTAAGREWLLQYTDCGKKSDAILAKAREEDCELNM